MSSPHIKLHDSVTHQSLKHDSLISLLNYTTERDIGVAVFWFEDNVLTVQRDIVVLELYY